MNRRKLFLFVASVVAWLLTTSCAAAATPQVRAALMAAYAIGLASAQQPGQAAPLLDDGAEYVYVPAGSFKMGAGAGSSPAFDDAKPQTTVNTDGFWIMRTEVTNAQYARCVAAGACRKPGDARWDDPVYAEHPVSSVTWYMANDYAQWAGGRLPTEVEWEKACRGTDRRRYPWGNEPPTAKLANVGHTTGDTMPVGSYPQDVSPYGVLDMAGNVWEWTSTLYPYVAKDGRAETGGDDARVVRGGAYHTIPYLAYCAKYGWRKPDLGADRIGFRVVQFP